MKKFISLISIISFLFILTSCSKPGYVKTDETEKALDLYINAVKKSEEYKSGNVKINVYQKTTYEKNEISKEILDYKYSVGENDEVIFTRTDYKNGEIIAKYQSEGEKVYNILNGKSDVTDEFSPYLKNKTNNINNLMMFRMDNKYRLKEDTISNISLKEQGGNYEITVDFNPKKLSGLLYKSTYKGVSREITKTKKVYKINKEGYIYFAATYATQKITDVKNSGEYISNVEAEYNH